MAKINKRGRVQKKLSLSADNWEFLLRELDINKGSMSDLVNRIIDVFKTMKGDLK